MTCLGLDVTKCSVWMLNVPTLDSASQFFYILISSYLLDKTGLLFSFYIFFSLPFCIKFFLEKVNLKSLTKLKSVARATSAYDINSVKDSPSMDQFYVLSVVYQTPRGYHLMQACFC